MRLAAGGEGGRTRQQPGKHVYSVQARQRVSCRHPGWVGVGREKGGGSWEGHTSTCG